MHAGAPKVRHDLGPEPFDVAQGLLLVDAVVCVPDQDLLRVAHFAVLFQPFDDVGRRAHQERAWLQEVPVEPGAGVDRLAGPEPGADAVRPLPAIIRAWILDTAQ